jgi:hypothetical protein
MGGNGEKRGFFTTPSGNFRGHSSPMRRGRTNERDCHAFLWIEDRFIDPGRGWRGFPGSIGRNAGRDGTCLRPSFPCAGHTR